MTSPNPQPAFSPLSLDRVTEVFDREGWKYDVDAGDSNVIRTGFSGLGLEIRFLEPTLSVVTTVAVDSITAKRFDDVLSWVETYNYSRAFPTVTALKDDARDVTALGAVYSLPGYWEYTDSQFNAHLHTGIEGVVQASRDFLQTFAPETLAQLDAQRPS